jgi:plastocyanin
VIQKLRQRTNGSFDQNFGAAWLRNFRLLHIKPSNGASGFWLILISVLSLTFGCRQNGQPAPSNAAPKQLSSDSIMAAKQAAGSGAVSGRVLFKGHASMPKPMSMRQDPACAVESEEQIYSEEVVLNSDRTLANVFVYIKEGLAQRQYAAPVEPKILDQHHCRYSPHVFGIQVGQTLKILNSDPTFHNVHAAAKNNKPFNLGMSKVEKVKTRTFHRAEVMIPLHCNVHPWMSAYVGVVDHPFYSVTDSTGSFKLQAVPPGEYVLAAWHEVFGSLEQKIKLADNESKSVDFIFTRR